MPASSTMERLRARGDFQRIFAAGKRVQNSWATLLFLPRDGTGVRVGYAVGKKFGGAVRRNRLKRRLRAICRAVLTQRVSAGGWDVVCLPRMRSTEADFATLQEKLQELFVLAGIVAGD